MRIVTAIGVLTLLSACATTSDLTRSSLPTQSIDAPPPPPPPSDKTAPLPTQPIDAPPPPPPSGGN